MVYTERLYQPPIVELAKAGNFQAIAHWINQYLMPYGMHASVSAVRPGCLKILVELPWVESGELPEERRDYLVRYICHRIWQLNSAVIEGAQIAAQFAGESRILWEQSVKVVSPARRSRQQESQELQTQVQQTAQRRVQLKTLRSLLVSGAPLFAFFFGCILGFSKAPVDQTNAVASARPEAKNSASSEQTPPRSDTVQAALEVVPVIKHDKVANPNDPTVTLMFAGDVTLGEEFENTVGKDYDHAFAAMDEYREADLAMVNLENPLTKATTPLPDKQFNFKADPESAQVLEKGGVDLVTLANNHTMDFEEAGLTETMETLDQKGILHLGAGRDEKEARRPEIVEVKGQRVAYLGYYGADFHAAGDKKAGTNFADEARIAADIKSIRDQVDWVVVNFHWGEELANYPAEWQVDLAHFTVDQGADLVVGHHPHVLQGAEIYKGRPIAYSLGNFIFGGNSRKDYDTAVLKVALKDKQMKVEFLPVEVRNYQPQVVTGDRASQILRQVDDLSNGFGQPMRSPAVLDARLAPKVEPSTAVPATKPPHPAESTAPFIEQKTPTDSASPSPQATPSSESVVPSPEASPSGSVPTTDATPAAEPTPAANTATPSPQPSTPTDASAPAVESPAPANGSVSSPESTYPGDATTPATQPSIPPDMAAPVADPTAPTGAANSVDQSPSAAEPSSSGTSTLDAENTISPSSDYLQPSDTTATDSHSDPHNDAATSESSDTLAEETAPSGSGDILTDPAEADRLLQEADRLLQENPAPSADTANTQPPAAVGGPADPVDPTAPAADSSTSADPNAPATNSGTSGDAASSAPIDFSQPPGMDASTSDPASSHQDASNQEIPPADPSAAPPEAAPGYSSEPDTAAPVDTSQAHPENQPAANGQSDEHADAKTREAEQIALRNLSGSSVSSNHSGSKSSDYDQASHEEVASVPQVALMAAAIW